MIGQNDRIWTLKSCRSWTSLFLRSQFRHRTEDAPWQRDQADRIKQLWRLRVCGNSQPRRRRRATRVSVERQVFAVVLGCPRVMCVTIPTGVSVTETSRGGSAKHGEQLRSRSGCVLQFSACAVIAFDLRQFRHIFLSLVHCCQWLKYKMPKGSDI